MSCNLSLTTRRPIIEIPTSPLLAAETKNQLHAHTVLAAADATSLPSFSLKPTSPFTTWKLIKNVIWRSVFLQPILAQRSQSNLSLEPVTLWRCPSHDVPSQLIALHFSTRIFVRLRRMSVGSTNGGILYPTSGGLWMAATWLPSDEQWTSSNKPVLATIHVRLCLSTAYIRSRGSCLFASICAIRRTKGKVSQVLDIAGIKESD